MIALRCELSETGRRWPVETMQSLLGQPLSLPSAPRVRRVTLYVDEMLGPGLWIEAAV